MLPRWLQFSDSTLLDQCAFCFAYTCQYGYCDVPKQDGGGGWAINLLEVAENTISKRKSLFQGGHLGH